MARPPKKVPKPNPKWWGKPHQCNKRVRVKESGWLILKCSVCQVEQDREPLHDD